MHLDDTLYKINDELKIQNNSLAEMYEVSKKLSYDDKKRGEHFNVNSKIEITYKRVASLNRSLKVPYFGRMDVDFENGDKKKIYIGRSGVIHNGSIVVTDWRAPVSSLYYDSEIGKSSYKAPEGKVNVNLSLKRQINIENSKLLDVQDSSLVTNDELLKPYLSEKTGEKMKTIIASIQKEQNDIIRMDEDENIIVQELILKRLKNMIQKDLKILKRN